MNESPSEKVFYQSDNILVTNSRFVANGTTFAMNNIASVRSHGKKSNFALFLLILGIVAFLAQSMLWTLLFVGIGAVINLIIKPTFSVKVTTNAGEQEGFSSTDSTIVQEVVDAINEAMIHRG